MSTKFKRLSSEAFSLLDQCSSLSSVVSDPPVDESILEAHYRGFGEIIDRLNGAIWPELAKFEVKAKETDPDKRIYGDSMSKTVLSTCDRVREGIDEISPVYEALKALVEPILESRERKRALEEAERLNEQRRILDEKEKEEEKERERIRAEQEIRRVAEENERRKKEQEEFLRREAEREIFEAEREIRRQRLAEEEFIRKAKEQRLEDAKSMPLEKLVVLMENANPPQVFQKMIRTVIVILHNISNSPENPQFRHLRKQNAQLGQDLTAHEYGVEVLLCLGFREKNLTQPTQECYFVLEEPDAEREMDRWTEWFDSLQNNIQTLDTIMDAF